MYEVLVRQNSKTSSYEPLVWMEVDEYIEIQYRKPYGEYWHHGRVRDIDLLYLVSLQTEVEVLSEVEVLGIRSSLEGCYYTTTFCRFEDFWKDLNDFLNHNPEFTIRAEYRNSPPYFYLKARLFDGLRQITGVDYNWVIHPYMRIPDSVYNELGDIRFVRESLERLLKNLSNRSKDNAGSETLFEQALGADLLT